jgi:membrane protease subunit HflC
MKSRGFIVVVLIIVAALIYASAYTIDETEQVVVTQFGKVIGDAKTEPGLNFKLPFIQQATYFPKNLLHWDGDPGQIPTLDKTFLFIDTFARWKIVDPVKFFQTVGDTFRALGRLDDIIEASVRNFVTSYPLIDTVRSSNRVLDTFEAGIDDGNDARNKRTSYVVSTGRAKIANGIVKQAQPKLVKFGIELVDVKFKRINYVEEVRKSVYGRMIAERQQIAEKFRSEGKGEAQKILGDKERDLQKITSEAYRKAQEIKGKADAEATRLYAEALNLDPEFYSFFKTLEVYRESIDDKSELILSTDSEFLRYLKNFE